MESLTGKGIDRYFLLKDGGLLNEKPGPRPGLF
jgi:hypothetical protein